MPISAYHPVVVDCTAVVTSLYGVRTPNLTLPPEAAVQSKDDFDDWCNEITEWLTLASLESPRILEGNTVDLRVSRYEALSPADPSTSNLRVLRWTGLLSPEWCTRLLISCVYVPAIGSRPTCLGKRRCKLVLPCDCPLPFCPEPAERIYQANAASGSRCLHCRHAPGLQSPLERWAARQGEAKTGILS